MEAQGFEARNPEATQDQNTRELLNLAGILLDFLRNLQYLVGNLLEVRFSELHRALQDQNSGRVN